MVRPFRIASQNTIRTGRKIDGPTFFFYLSPRSFHIRGHIHFSTDLLELLGVHEKSHTINNKNCFSLKMVNFVLISHPPPRNGKWLLNRHLLIVLIVPKQSNGIPGF